MIREPSVNDRSGDRSYLDAALAVGLFVAALGYFSISATRTFDVADEGMFLYYAARVAAGEVPYRDFLDIYGPGVFAVGGVTLWASDGSLLALRAVLALWKASAVVLTFVVARPASGRPFAVLGSLFAIACWGRPTPFLNTPYASIYTLPICLFAVLLLIRALRVDSRAAFAVAGLAAGTAILFKQSLGVMNALGMVLSMCAVRALEAPELERTRRGAWRFLALWLPAAGMWLVPAVSQLGSSDYVLHFLPLHAFMGMIVVGAILRGARGLDAGWAWRRLAPLALGMAAPPLLALAALAAAGAAPAQVAFCLLRLPLAIENYYFAVPLPPLGRVLLIAGVLGAVASTLLALRGRRAASVLVGLAALAALSLASLRVPYDLLPNIGGRPPRASPATHWLAALASAPAKVAGVEAGATIFAATLLLASGGLLSARGHLDLGLLRRVTPLVFFTAMLSFQVFPRGSYNLWIAQGGLAPLLIIVLSGWRDWGAPRSVPAARRFAASCLVAAVLLWLAAPSAQALLHALATEGPRSPAAFPEARGLAFSESTSRRTRLRDLEALVAFLKAAEPRDAPVFLVTSDYMALHLSGRQHLFRENDYLFFLHSWDMLPGALRADVSEPVILGRLREHPEALVVIRADRASERLFGAAPALRESIAKHYEPWAMIGPYGVYRRKMDPRRSLALPPPLARVAWRGGRRPRDTGRPGPGR